MFEFLFGAKKRKRRCDRRRKKCKPKKRYNVSGSPCNRVKRRPCRETNYCNYVKLRGCRRSKFFNSRYPGIPLGLPELPRLLGLPEVPRSGGRLPEVPPPPEEDEAEISNEYTDEQLNDARRTLNVEPGATRQQISNSFRRFYINAQRTGGSPEEKARRYRELNDAKRMLFERTPNFGRPRRRRSTGFGKKRSTKKKIPSKIRKLCKKLKIKTTRKVGNKRVRKSLKMLMKQIKNKIKVKF